MFKETRDAPAEAKPKHPATILGMPAVLPPADLAGPQPKRATMPPPPPPGGLSGTRPPAPPTPGLGRSVPPPPPRTQPPAPPGAGRDALAGLAPPARSVPPAPPSSSPLHSTLNGTGPAARGALLNMDWDDEELSTQIYDRPADEELPSDGGEGYEQVEGGFQELSYEQAAAGQLAPGYGAPAFGAAQPPHDAGYGAQSPGYEAPASVRVGSVAYSEPAYRVEPVPSMRPPNALTQTMTMATTDRPPERGRNPLYGFLAVAAVLLLCFVGYVFLSRTEPGVVQLTTHPADAVLLFDGKPVGTSSPFVVTGVSPNQKHTLEVQKQGYRSWAQEVQVQAGQTLQFPVTLQPQEGQAESPAVAGVGQQATGTFSIETSPSGAAVFLDGQELSGVTPLRVGNLLPRAYDLRLKLEGFREHRARVEVRSGIDQSLPRVVLEAERVHVRVSSEPAGAEAVLTRGAERRTLGKTPVDVTLDNDGSRWTVEVSKSGYESFSQPVVLQDGSAELALRAVLQRRGGDEVAAVQPAASSDTPRSAPLAGGEPTRPAVSAREPASAPEGAGGQGTLRINSRPWSQVVIDGRPFGNTPQMNLVLPAGTHRVTLVNPEFNLRKNLTVTIKAGQVETQIVTLQ